MRKDRYVLHLLIIIAVAIGLASCKPTEKNYSAAYEAARAKRENDELKKQELEKDMGADFKSLKSVDANRSRFTAEIPDSLGGGKLELPLISTNISRADSVLKYSAAVAKFKMQTNAEGLAADLRSEQFPKSRAVFSGDAYFVIIDENDDALALVPSIRRFQSKMKVFPYVGLEELTLLRRLR